MLMFLKVLQKKNEDTMTIFSVMVKSTELNKERLSKEVKTKRWKLSMGKIGFNSDCITTLIYKTDGQRKVRHGQGQSGRNGRVGMEFLSHIASLRECTYGSSSFDLVRAHVQ